MNPIMDIMLTIGIPALIVYGVYWLAKKLLKFGIDYYFNMKSMVHTFEKSCDMADAMSGKVGREEAKQEK